MTGRRVTAILGGGAVAAVATLTLAAGGHSERDGSAGEAAARTPTSTPAPGAPRTRPHGVVENCSTRSEANFPAAFSDRGSVVVGPLVLVGAAYTPPETVREYGGNKFPLLVRAGHRVTLALSRRTH